MNLAARSSSIVVLFCVCLVAGCDMAEQLMESSKHAAPIEAEIEAAVGKKPSVFSAGTGDVLVVNVQFSEVPSLPLPAIEAIARAAIVREFEHEPVMLTLSFVYQKQWPAGS